MHRPLRRLLTSTGLSLVVVALLAVPAWAAPSFVDGEAESGGPHTDALQVPEDQRIGATSSVTMTVPQGFVTTGCTRSAPISGDCEFDGTSVTWTGKGALPFGFTVDIAAGAGSHEFVVVQADELGETLLWTVVMTVAATDDGEDSDDGDGEDGPGAGDPSPQPTTAPTPVPSATPAPTPSAAPSPSGSTPSPAPSAAVTSDDDASAESSTSSGGSTAPTRTRGRSTGTTLEVTPAESAAEQDPAIAAPAVADEPAVTTPTGGDSDVDESATAAVAAAEAPAGDRPWQQVLGAALLGVGVAIVGVRQWRSR